MDINRGRKYNGNANDAAGIFSQTRDLIASCDLLIANMSPFRGPSLEAGTALEIGLMLGLNKPVVGYSLDNEDYAKRLMRLHDVFDLPLNEDSGDLQAPDGLLVENFGLVDSALVTGAVQSAKMPVSEDFEIAVRWGRRLLSD